MLMHLGGEGRANGAFSNELGRTEIVKTLRQHRRRLQMLGKQLADRCCHRDKRSRRVGRECTEAGLEPCSVQIVPMLSERGGQQGECSVKLIGGGRSLRLRLRLGYG